MIIPFGTTDFQSHSEDVARIRMRNMYLVENPMSPDGVSRVTRPNCTTYTTIGTGPIFGLWRQSGSLGADVWLAVSAQELWKREGGVNTLIGTIPGVGRPVFAGNSGRVVIVRDGLVYSTDGITLVAVPMPDDKLVSSVACIDSVFLLSIKDSQLFYWMQPDETGPDPLSFASAERTPDGIVDIQVISDEIWLIGAESTEVWQSTGDLDSPYQRIAGRAYTQGCISVDTVVTGSFQGYSCAVWVTDKKTVVIAQGSPSKISNLTVEEFLRNATNLRAWMFRSNKNTFYVMTADQGTYVYDLEMKNWVRWDSYGRKFWRAHLGIQVNDAVYGCDAVTNKVFLLDEGLSDDDDPIIREVSAFVPNTGKYTSCDSVNIRCNVGWADKETFLELRWSDDGGFTFSPYLQLSMGKTGEYGTDVTARSLGKIYRPGRVFEVRYAGIGRFRLDYASMNEV